MQRKAIFLLFLFLPFFGVNALANPQGPQVVHGQAGFNNPNSNTLQVTNSPNAIINWQGFSIQQNEITRFVQESVNSAVLNRVTGSDPSDIFGQLLSNGRVFLINPNGMVFGPDSVIDTAGFVASTLNMSDEDFLEGKLNFEGGPENGDIINQGFITSGKNGDIYLIAPNIENSGIIHTIGGNLILAAGEKVTITSLDTQGVYFEIQAPENETVNLGKLLADGGAVGIFAGTLIHEGEISANTVELDEQGSIVLKALDNIQLAEGSVVTANGENGLNGGRIQIIAGSGISDEDNATVFQQGVINADGNIGGTISIQADAMLASSEISADGTDQGGDINIQLNRRLLATNSSHVSVDGGYGGNISILAGESLYTSGTYSATGIQGGTIHLLGDEVKLASATVDVSGNYGGGDIRVGGGFQGNEADLPNARITIVNGGATLLADALKKGDGGSVVVWSDEETRFSGTITAIGGEEYGNGGEAEVSGRISLSYNGLVDLSAPEGNAGTLLLDPRNITIQETIGPSIIELIDPNPQAGDLFGGSYEQELSNGYIAVHEPNDDFAGTDAGAFYIFDPSNGDLVSAFTGTQAGDHIGDYSLWNMGSDYYILRSTQWGDYRGALTLFNADTGISGSLSSTNSLVGAATGDYIGYSSYYSLGNDKYLIRSSYWGDDAGSVTWFDITQGLSGVVGATNSLVGSIADDDVGSYIYSLGNNKWGIFSPYWDNGSATDAGAVTIIDSEAGIPTGMVSSANSLVGTNTGDYVGSYYYYYGYYPDYSTLSGSILMIRSRYWYDEAGAVTLYDTLTDPITGEISASNSLVGGTPGDQIGLQYQNLTYDNKFAFISPNWNSGTGAVTIFDMTEGISGEVSDANSLVGTNPGDYVGSGGVNYISYSNDGTDHRQYLIISPDWNSGAGAVTWYSTANAPVTGELSGSNSLIGGSGGDGIGEYQSVSYGGGYSLYALLSPDWYNESEDAEYAGAITLFDPVTGTFFSDGSSLTGTIDNTNSLVGTNTGDNIGLDGLDYLTYTYDGSYHYKYLSRNPNWNSGAGAVTWIDTDIGITGDVSAENSFVGSTAGDGVGSDVSGVYSNVYAIISPDWDNGGAADAGAVTLFDRATGMLLTGDPLVGEIYLENSLVGVNAGSRVGSGGIEYLSGYYQMVRSPEWNDGSGTNLGALTWFDASAGLTGMVDDMSFTGEQSDDNVGSSSLISIGNSQYLIVSPDWDNGTIENAGAVTTFDYTAAITGSHGIEVSLIGTNPGDGVGSGGIYNLYDDNYFLYSPDWNSGAGALTWFNNSPSLPTGTIDGDNSLIGSSSGDQIGSEITYLGYYDTSYKWLIQSPNWNSGAGAITWIDSSSAIIGEINSENSLVGSAVGDFTDSSVSSIYGNVRAFFAPNWDNGSVADAGSVTLFDAATGYFYPSGTQMIGTIDPGNSLVGTNAYDNVGIDGYTSLGSGYFLINSYDWNGGAGAVTWMDVTTGIAGVVSSENSLVGSTSGDMDSIYTRSFGNYYALAFTEWDNGAAENAGALTFFEPDVGITGIISDTNSLVGDQAGDRVGTYDPDYVYSYRAIKYYGVGGDGYIIFSPDWHDSTGALTWVDLSLGPPSGVINNANSFVGSNPGDLIGIADSYYGDIGFNSLGSGIYGMLSPYYNGSAGAITWISDLTSGLSGEIDASNSLLGSTAGDGIASNWSSLPNGKYYLRMPSWDNGAITDAGAVTIFDIDNLPTGPVSSANSLVGTHTNDYVGNNYYYSTGGNYVIFRHTNWNDGAGAVTWYDTTTDPITGEISGSNSLIGSTAEDGVGSYYPYDLGNGKYMLRMPYWDNGSLMDAGAITIFDSATSLQGTISSSNSLVGTHEYDRLGYTVLNLGGYKYLFLNYNWNEDTGAVTWYDSANDPIYGEITNDNSMLGSSPGDRLGLDYQNLGDYKLLFTAASADTSAGADAGRIYHFTFPIPAEPGDLLFSNSPSTDFTLSIESLLATLNTGTALLLQANNDISLLADLYVDNTSGDGGSLTFMAGRSIYIDADIFTDNGDFIAIANASEADGVVTEYRISGEAGISMADGTTIDAGTGNITLEVGTGSTSGDITIANLIGQDISLTMNGTTSGSSILRASEDSLITASSLFIDYTGLNGSVGTSTEPLRVYADNLTAYAESASPGIFFDLQNSGTTVIDGLENGEQIILTSLGAIDSTGPIITDLLEVSANGAIDLGNTGNTVARLNASSSTNGVTFVNSAGLALGSVSAWGDVHVEVLSGSITDNNGTDVNVAGNHVVLQAPVNIGTLADPLETDMLSVSVINASGEVGLDSVHDITFGSASGESQITEVTADVLLIAPNISFNDEMTIPGAIDLRASEINIAYNLTAGGITLIPTTAVNLSADLDAGTGTINATGGSGILNITGDSTINGDTFSTGTLNISSAIVTLNSLSSIGTLNLSGGTLNSAGDITINNVLDWTGGDIFITGDYYNGAGSVFNAKADGSLNVGTFYNNGTLTMGGSPGTLTIVGNYVQGSEGLLDIELGGLEQGVTYDWLNITGSAELDGTLDLSLFGGFAPNVGDLFDVISYSGVTGDFATMNVPTGYGFLSGDQGTFYQLEVTTIPYGSLPFDPFANILTMVEQADPSEGLGIDEPGEYDEDEKEGEEEVSGTEEGMEMVCITCDCI